MKNRYCINCNSLVKNKKALRCKPCENIRRKFEGINKGEDSYNWKGDDVGYQGIHRWLDRNYGKPRLCEHCFTTSARFFDWANLSGKYIRDRNDYKRLCRRCHIKMDLKDSCKNGHKYTESNTKIEKGGVRRCRICKAVKEHKYYLKNKDIWNVKR